jgi:hypothetical protein
VTPFGKDLTVFQRNVWYLVAFGCVSLAAWGCGESSGSGTDTRQTAKASTQATVAEADDKSQPNDGWWCAEHGVPEEICAQCNQKLVAEFKAKGDWCKKHDRPESQCFLCHPELEAKFAAQYEAKYGKKPPKPEAAEKEAKDSKS